MATTADIIAARNDADLLARLVATADRLGLAAADGTYAAVLEHLAGGAFPATFPGTPA